MRRARRLGQSEAALGQVAAARREACQLTDLGLVEATASIRRRLAQGTAVMQCLPEAFAIITEAARRSTGTVVTDSQLAAARNVLQGTVAELRDGEGKGVAAILAAYVSSLAGMRVHVVTLDDYLARRDLLRARSILELVGISTAQAGSAHCRSTGKYPDITYGSYAGFASDYLEDNLVADARELVQSERDFAIVDEADSILIDHARCRVLIIADDTGDPDERRRFVQHSQPECHESSSAVGRKILAECRIRDYFRAYRKLAGLTATAAQATARFRHFYGMDVVPVPGSGPDTREDRDDLWYGGTGRMLADLELRAVDCRDRGQPVLVKAGTDEVGREISRRLSGRGVTHAVLRPGSSDAARVMAQAGTMGAVTIVTETAGRGYGVRLGGDLSYTAEGSLATAPESERGGLSGAEMRTLTEARAAAAGSVEAERARVVAAGGLVVLGAFQSGSARADNWARGLAGQRGEPGETQFYHSSEEYSVLREDGKIIQGQTRKNTPPMTLGKSLRGRFLRSAINDVYRNSEKHAFSRQRDMADFDDLMDRHRREAYKLRKAVFDGSSESLDRLSAFDRSWAGHLTRQDDLYSQSISHEGLMDKKAVAELCDKVTADFNATIARIKEEIVVAGHE